MRNYRLLTCLVMTALLLAACGGASTAPSNPPPPQPSATNARPVAANPTSTNPAPSNAASGNTVALQPQTVEGGSVTVKVTPLTVKRGEPLAFDVAMDTHSVDLAGDMLKIVVLRDDTGKEYAPTAWDGAGPGGHHREGKIQFEALAANPKSLTLVVRNLAGVPERIFTWDVSQ